MSQAALQHAPRKSASQRTPSFTASRGGLLQRKCACGGTPGPTGECEACRKKKLQRKGRDSGAEAQNDSAIPRIVHEVLRSPGQPLDSDTRAFMEPRFGHDFGKVRIHTDAKAAESARAVSALAYTVGHHIAVRSDKHAPGTTPGRLLLAHELAHVVQQSGGSGGSDQELRAEGAAHRIMGGQQASSEIVGAAPLGLYRQHEGHEPKDNSAASEDELIKLVRGHFVIQQRNNLFQPIPPTSPLHPKWQPKEKISMLKPKEYQPQPNLDRLSGMYRQGWTPAKPLKSGVNPFDPDAERKEFTNRYAMMSDKGPTAPPTDADVVFDQVKEGLTEFLSEKSREFLSEKFPEVSQDLKRLKRSLFGKIKRLLESLSGSKKNERARY
jgi:uncharacterized protein DUF4157